MYSLNFINHNLKSISFRMIGLLYAKGIVLVSTIFVARNLGPENFGHIRLVLALFNLLGILAGFPMERVVASLVAKNPADKKNILFHSIIFLTGIIIVAVIIFYAILSLFNIINDDIAKNIFFRYAPFVFAFVFSYVLIAFLQGSGKIKAMTLGEIIYGSLKAFSIILFVYFAGNSGWLPGRISGEVLAFFAMIILVFGYFRKLIKGRNFKFDFNFIKKLWRYYLYRLAENGLASIQINLDVFLVIWLVNDVKQIAYIGAAKMFLDSFGLFGKSITSGLFPAIAKLHNQKKLFLKHLKKTQFAANIAFAIILLPFFIFAKPLVILLYKTEYIQAVPYLKIFIITALFQNISYINGGYWLAIGNVKLSTKFSLISFVAYILLSFAMMFFYDVFGIILAIMISKIFNAFVSTRLNRECIT